MFPSLIYGVKFSQNRSKRDVDKDNSIPFFFVLFPSRYRPTQAKMNKKESSRDNTTLIEDVLASVADTKDAVGKRLEKYHDDPAAVKGQNLHVVLAVILYSDHDYYLI